MLHQIILIVQLATWEVRYRPNDMNGSCTESTEKSVVCSLIHAAIMPP